MNLCATHTALVGIGSRLRRDMGLPAVQADPQQPPKVPGAKTLLGRLRAHPSASRPERLTVGCASLNYAKGWGKLGTPATFAACTCEFVRLVHNLENQCRFTLWL